MHVSLEVPVFKGRFLRPCIDSLRAQTSDAWTLSLLWDGGDEQSREILEQLQRERHPRVRVYFAENRGIAGARKFLTEHTDGDYILPVDDDDILPPHAVERFLQFAAARPWASLIRGRRVFIDGEGAAVGDDPWFPFGPRSYDRGMVTDVFNQAQPYLIRRSAYERTRGWTGFADFNGAGEDCEMFLQLEEVAHFELIDEVLYHYRLHGARASHALTSAAAFEMWRRLADAAIVRMGLPLRRISAAPPFAYESLPRPAATLDDVDFVVRGGGGKTVAPLLRGGVDDDAIHETADVPGRSPWRMTGFRSTRRPLVCFLDEDVVVRSRFALEALVRTLDGARADLLATSGARNMTLPLAGGEILLVRREVIAATGGFDDRHVPETLQAADFWIQARRRGFCCVTVPLEGVIARSRSARWTPADVSALNAKWRSYANLLEPYAAAGSSSDASTAAGDGARRNRSSSRGRRSS